MWVVSLSLQLSITAAGPGWTIGHVIGILLWSIGLFFEAVGDWQLFRFRANPANKGRVLDTGLWSWTRHPNYFGDSCLWSGLFLIAAAHGGSSLDRDWTTDDDVLSDAHFRSHTPRTNPDPGTPWICGVCPADDFLSPVAAIGHSG